jgi:molecular chaperone DnaK (HSP70)
MLEAHASAESDRRVIELIGMRNKLDSLVRNTQLTFVEFGGALSADERHEAQETIAQGERAAHSDDPEEIRRALTSVERLAAQLTNVMLNPNAAPVKEIEGSH